MPNSSPSLKQRLANIPHNKPKASFVASTISTILILVATFCMAFALILSFMGMRTMYVISNSMEPAFSKGDLLVVSKDYNGLAVGDVVAYKATWAEGRLVTHRITAINGDEITVRGDNNTTADPVFDRSQIYGEIVSTFPKAGFIFNPYTIISMTFVGLLLSYLSDWLKPVARHVKSKGSWWNRFKKSKIRKS